MGGVTQVRFTSVLLTPSRQLDLLFMIDNSSSMRTPQTRLAAQMATFVASLSESTGGLPDLHIAVISSSLGAGAVGDVPGCLLGHPGDDGGKFQVKAGCGLKAGETFIKAAPGSSNVIGNVGDVLGCLSQLGEGGCGFEHQLESIRVALSKSANPFDSDNGGFFRQDAALGVVIFSNEDDCSVPADSQLFNTSVATLADQPPLGGLWSYRCNEFGHKCDQSMPHAATGLPMTLTGCASKENTDGLYHLVPVKDYVEFFKTVKTPEKLFVAVVAGQAAPYEVHARDAKTSAGQEQQPEISHSCTAADGTYADPGLRLIEFASDLNGIFLPICAADYKDVVTQIGKSLVRALEAPCIEGPIALKVNGEPNCQVVLRTGSSGSSGWSDTPLPYCTGANASASVPCWTLESPSRCSGGHVLKVCYDATCGPAPSTTNISSALLTCAVN